MKRLKRHSMLVPSALLLAVVLQAPPAAAAVTAALNSGTLTVTLGAPSDSAIVRGDVASTGGAGESVTVSGTGFAAASFVDVRAINVVDGGANAGQSVHFTSLGNGTFDMSNIGSGAIAVTGVESIDLSTAGTLKAGSFSESGAVTGVHIATDVTTTGTQIYSDPVTLDTHAILTTGGASSAAAIDTSGHQLTIDGPGTFTVTGVISGSGGLVKDGSGVLALSNSSNSPGPTTINAGQVSIPNGGGIVGDVENVAGHLSPFASAFITGQDKQDLGGSLTIDLGGIGPGQYSDLAVSGNVLLDGNVDFTLTNGFTPSAGDLFTFLTSTGAVFGTFAATNFTNWSCPAGDTCTDVFGPHSVTLEILPSTTPTPTPEPGSMLLLGTGLVGVAMRWRKRKAHA